MKKNLFLLGLVLVLSFTPQVCFADVTWEPDVRLTNDPSYSSPSQDHSIATDSQGRVHVVWADDGGAGNKNVYYKRSLDGGQTWENRILLTVSGFSFSPSIATDSQGRVHVVFGDNRDYFLRIYYRYSLDGGQTWGNEVPLVMDRDSRNPDIATDSQNRVHVVWIDERDNNYEIYYKRSLNGGQTWGPDTRLTFNSADSSHATIATDSQNRVHLVWQDNRYGNPEIYYKRSLDGGQAWGNDVRFTTNSAFSTHPSIATDSESGVHVVWLDGPDGNWGVYYKRSLNGGDSWDSNRHLVLYSGAEEAFVATDLQNRVHVAWQDDRDLGNGYNEIYYKRSVDGGNNWGTDTRLTRNSANSFEPSIATDFQNKIHVVWNDYRDNNNEIYYKRGTQSAKWTVMVYGAADNDLDLSGVEDLNEIEYVGSQNDVNMVYLLDRYGVNDTKLYYAQKDPAGQPDGSDMNIISKDISDSARSWLVQEEDMNNPQTLEDFALWTMANYPADNYLISIWDHGDGIFLQNQTRCSGGISEGMAWDDHGGVPDDYIDLAEFRDVLAALYMANNNQKLNIVGLDACLMGQVETFYQMKDYVDFGIASEEKEPVDGWEYGYPFEELVGNPDMPARDLASRIVDFYAQRYQNDPDPLAQKATIAAVDIGVLPSTLIPNVNNFAGYLYSFMNPFETAIQTARSSADVYNPDGENPDLYHFSQLIAQDTSLPLSLRNSADQVMAGYPGFIVNEWHGSQSPNAHGLSIWFPWDYTNNAHYPDYLTKIDFSQEKWDEFLGIYETPFEVLSLKLTLNTPIVHRGENLSYTAELGNLSWVSHNLKTWLDLTLPDGNPYPGNPVVGPMNLNLGHEQSVQRNLIYKIPQRTPFGTYTATGNLSTIDDYLLDQDSFDFSVTPVGLRFNR